AGRDGRSAGDDPRLLPSRAMRPGLGARHGTDVPVDETRRRSRWNDRLAGRPERVDDAEEERARRLAADERGVRRAVEVADPNTEDESADDTNRPRIAESE